jgi:hypothetical protein
VQSRHLHLHPPHPPHPSRGSKVKSLSHCFSCSSSDTCQCLPCHPQTSCSGNWGFSSFMHSCSISALSTLRYIAVWVWVCYYNDEMLFPHDPRSYHESNSSLVHCFAFFGISLCILNLLGCLSCCPLKIYSSILEYTHWFLLSLCSHFLVYPFVWLKHILE